MNEYKHDERHWDECDAEKAETDMYQGHVVSALIFIYDDEQHEGDCECDEGHTLGLINVRFHECYESDSDLVVIVKLFDFDA